MCNDELISKSKNIIKATCEITKKETGNKNHHNTTKSLRINNTAVNNYQQIACAFNDYFSTIADTIIDNIKKGNDEPKDDIRHFSYLTQQL
jgi:hypothetical protein